MSERRGDRMILRSIGAVLAGLIAVFVLSIGTDMALHASGTFPKFGEPMAAALFVVATAYRTIYGVVGGYITARFAPDRPIQHALALGIVGVILSTAGAVATRNAGPSFGPKWYPIGLIVIAIPVSWVGGKIRGMQLR